MEHTPCGSGAGAAPHAVQAKRASPSPQPTVPAGEPGSAQHASQRRWPHGRQRGGVRTGPAQRPHSSSRAKAPRPSRGAAAGASCGPAAASASAWRAAASAGRAAWTSAQSAAHGRGRRSKRARQTGHAPTPERAAVERTTQLEQNAWPHGSAAGRCSASRQTAQLRSSSEWRRAVSILTPAILLAVTFPSRHPSPRTHRHTQGAGAAASECRSRTRRRRLTASSGIIAEDYCGLQFAATLRGKINAAASLSRPRGSAPCCPPGRPADSRLCTVGCACARSRPAAHVSESPPSLSATFTLSSMPVFHASSLLTLSYSKTV